MDAVVSSRTPLTRGLFFGNWRFGSTALVVLLACLAPFFPGVGGPFQLDDTVNLESVHIGEASFSAIYAAAFSNTSGPLGRPLSNLTFVANQLLGGYDPFGYKLVNLGLHLMVGILVFALARRLHPLLVPTVGVRRNYAIALATAALWTIHPLQVSTALYVVQRMTQLSTLFMLAAVLLALAPLTKPGELPRPADGFRHAVCVGFVAVVAVLCKETGALVPFLLLSITLALPKATRAATADTSGKRVFFVTAVVIPILLFIVACFAFADRISSGYALRDFSMGQRLITEPWIIGGYLRSFFLPDLRTLGLFLDGYPMRSPTEPLAWLGAALVLLSVVGAFALRRRLPVLAFAVFWFLAAHLLESTFLPLEPAFEHRNYLALLGPSLLVSTAVANLANLLRPRIAVLVMTAILLTFGAITFLRSSTWSSQQRFIESEVRHHPASVRAQTEAAVLDSQQGNNETAIFRVRAIRETHPNDFFPAGMDMDFGCAIPGYPVDWGGVLDAVRKNPHHLNITSLHKTVALKILQGQCEGDIRTEFEAHLDKLIELYREAGMARQQQFFLMVKADFQRDQDAARRVLHEAVAAAPGNDAALHRLAYFELNSGNVKDVGEVVAILRRRTPWWHPSSYRVAELEGHLAQLQADLDSR